MNKESRSFEDFLSEISASLTGDSGEVSLRRINTERVLKLVLDDIVEQRHDVQIRVLHDSRIAGESGADILMQIDDYDIRLEIIDTPDNVCRLTKDQLINCREIFEENPSTETLILTWTTSELLSIQITLGLIDQIKLRSLDQLSVDGGNQDQLETDPLLELPENVRPLTEVINSILESRVKVWEKILVKPEESRRSSTNIRRLFESHLLQCLSEERSRSFKIEERKAAAENLSEQDVKEFMGPILDQALNAEKTENIAKLLAQLPKRGGK